MRVLSWNVRGLNSPQRQRCLRDVIAKSKPLFIMLQEVKIKCVDYDILRAIGLHGGWSYHLIPAVGKAGGVLSIWQDTSFSVSEIEIYNNSLCWSGTFLPRNLYVAFCNIYAPGTSAERRSLWEALACIAPRLPDAVLWAGDFSTVLSASERRNCTFNRADSRAFQSFISELGVIDMPLSGSLFTWYCASKSSRIDRCLIADSFLSDFGLLVQSSLQRFSSDHRSLLVTIEEVNWGPRPIKFLNVWLKHPDFLTSVRRFWESYPTHASANFSLWSKLKSLRLDLKTWNIEVFGNAEEKVRLLVSEINAIDLLRESRDLSEDELAHRSWLNALLILQQKIVAKIWRQKSRLHWFRNGDRCTRYFHKIANFGALRNKLSTLRTSRGYILDPAEIKEVAVAHFEGRFSAPLRDRLHIPLMTFKCLSDGQRLDIEKPFSLNEIESAIADCGGEKSPGPDGFTKKFLSGLGHY